MMCTWRNAEEDRETRLNACLAALEIQEQIDAFNRERERPDEKVPIRIGLNAGRMALANVGGRKHGGYGPVGDIPNGAARIEGLNKTLDTSLLASAQVVDGLDELKTRLKALGAGVVTARLEYNLQSGERTVELELKMKRPQRIQQAAQIVQTALTWPGIRRVSWG